VNAAGAIHTDLEHHFIRAETIHWDQLLEAGSEAEARARGTLRLEGKEYVVKDGDVMHRRHSGSWIRSFEFQISSSSLSSAHIHC